MLIIVDLQNDFCEGGALAVERASSIVPHLNETLQYALDKEIEIVFTRDWHPQDHSSFADQGGPWPPHCVRDTVGAQFHPDLIVPNIATIISKGTEVDGMGYSPFETEELGRLVGNEETKGVIICGLTLEYCIRATCLDAIEFGKPVYVIKPLIRAISQDEQVIADKWGELKQNGVGIIQSINEVL